MAGGAAHAGKAAPTASKWLTGGATGQYTGVVRSINETQTRWGTTTRHNDTVTDIKVVRRGARLTITTRASLPGNHNYVSRGGKSFAAPIKASGTIISQELLATGGVKLVVDFGGEKYRSVIERLVNRGMDRIGMGRHIYAGVSSAKHTAELAFQPGGWLTYTTQGTARTKVVTPRSFRGVLVASTSMVIGPLTQWSLSQGTLVPGTMQD